MLLKDTIQISLTGLKTNLARSALTTLGIVIGIAAIILVMSIGQGAQNLILDQIQGLGSRTIIVEPGREPRGPSDFASILSDSLKDREVDAIRKKANVRGLSEITPMVMVPGTIIYRNETTRATTLGASELVADILGIFPERGSFFNDEDINQKANVAVIGSEVKNNLFGLSDAIGEKIKIKNKLFRVIGVLPAKGQVALFNVDELVIVPYTTAQTYLTGTNHYNSIMIQAESEEIISYTVSDVELTLRELHGITEPDKDDFHVITQADIAERVGSITGILTALLVSVAAISLIVGGIGIMNIMLVSVTERTREIGLRKAIGATRKDIMNQFLLEAVVLTLLGGFIGIIFGAGLSFAASVILGRFVAEGWQFSFPVSAALLGFGVSAFIGLVFGIYPARQAAKKRPIEALRYE